MTSPPASAPTVLLFYDGYERHAEPTLAGSLKATLRRHARFLVRTLRRQQTRTGFYTWFFMLHRALVSAGVNVRVNDFAAARRFPEMPIGAAGYPDVLRKLDGLSNPRLIGPGVYGTPADVPKKLFDDPRNALYLQTCDWAEELFRPWFGDRQRRWFGGYDISAFQDASTLPKTWDVLVYDKIYFDRDKHYARTIAPFLKKLDEQGLTYTVVRYGSYHQQDYMDKVRASRSMAFFAHSETQGMAYQECLASNVPIFAWDEGVWPHPCVKELGLGETQCNSVPYFDDRCGVKFKAENMMEQWDAFRAELGAFEPRRFIAEEMTLQKSAEAYLRAYNEVARMGAKPATVGAAHRTASTPPQLFQTT